MRHYRIPPSCLTALVVGTWWFATALRADEGFTAPAQPTDAQALAQQDAMALARQIDEQLAQRWDELNVLPAEPASDAAFLRRIYLDFCGKIPTAWEVREFLADERTDKRQRAVERLIESPSFVTYQAALWRKILLPEANNDPTVRMLAQPFEAWLRREWMQQRSLRETALALLAARQSELSRPGFGGTASPAIFYSAKSGKPEELAASVARAFLGLRIECAQCHDHPFDRWKQSEFWELAAFFGQLSQQQPEAGIYSALNEQSGVPQLEIPGTDQRVAPRFPDGATATFEGNQNTREVLADWLTSDGNAWFARSAANRVWAQFFGTGLVDPVDDFSAANPPSHPQLLEILAHELVAHDFDLRHLMRGIALSRAYALSSQSTLSTEPDPQWFCVAPVRRMSSEQIAASVVQALGRPIESGAGPNPNDPVASLQETYQETGDPATDASTSIIQALTLMNGRLAVEATDLAASHTLAAIVETPGLSPRQQIEMLFLATLSRLPTAEESDTLVGYFKDATSSSTTALADIFWALLNSTEFVTNH